MYLGCSNGGEREGNSVLHRFDWCASIQREIEGMDGCDTSFMGKAVKEQLLTWTAFEKPAGDLQLLNVNDQLSNLG